MRNKKLLLGVTALMTAGVLAAGASSTAAWFLANRTATLNINSIGFSADTGDLQIAYGNTLCGHALSSTTLNTNKDKLDVTATDYKITATSSKDGTDLVYLVQNGNEVTFEDCPTSGATQYLRFYVALINNSKTDLDIYLDASATAITGDASAYARVALDELKTDAVPTQKGTTKVTFMDNAGAKGNYCTKFLSDETTPNSGVLNDTQDAWATDPEESAATGLKKDINANSDTTDDVTLGTLNAASGDPLAATTGYVVVTVWFEGTEMVNQNAMLTKTFNVKIVFGAKTHTA